MIFTTSSKVTEPDYDRAIEQADRIRKRLGDTIGRAIEDDEFPPKPPRMRWKTYHELQVVKPRLP
jgi:hypothetical protein